MTYIKNNILSLLLILFFVMFILFGKGGCARNEGKADTVYSRTTEYIQQPTQYVPEYRPIIVESRQPVIIPQQYQPSTDPAALKIQFEEIVKKYLAENRYQDSTVLRDSAGNNVGVFRNNDLVSENMIKSRSPNYTLRFPHTTERITITQPAKLTRQIFLGPELSGTAVNPVRDVGVGLLYKDKKDNLYRFATGYTLPTGQQYFELSRYWKLSFKP